jgi:hypothetical protein
MNIHIKTKVHTCDAHFSDNHEARRTSNHVETITFDAPETYLIIGSELKNRGKLYMITGKCRFKDKTTYTAVHAIK